jgi:acyl carrier protein
MPKGQEEALPATIVRDLRADVSVVLKEIIKRRNGTAAADDYTEETLLKDIGLDSFDAIECIFQLEEHYKVDIDFNANNPESKIETIADFIDIASCAIAVSRKQ